MTERKGPKSKKSKESREIPGANCTRLETSSGHKPGELAPKLGSAPGKQILHPFFKKPYVLPATFCDEEWAVISKQESFIYIFVPQ